MRVMVIVKATQESEAGQMPSEELLAAMGNFNEQLVKAGVMLAGEGLHPTMRGKRVRFAGQQAHRDRRTVCRDQGADRRLLAVAGEVAWKKRSSGSSVSQSDAGESEIEIRPVFEAEDFGAEFTPELREQEERQRADDRTPRKESARTA